METKICSACVQQLTLDNFSKGGKDRKGNPRLKSKCKKCVSDTEYKNNTDKVKERVKKYKEENKEKVLQSKKDSYYKNHEKNKEKFRKNYEINRDKILTRQREARKKNPFRYKTYAKKHYLKNKEKICKKSINYFYANWKHLTSKNRTLYWNNREKRLQSKKEWYENGGNEVQRLYNQRYKTRKNELRRIRWKTDLDWNLKCRMSCSMRRALKDNKNYLPTFSLVNYTVVDLKTRLETTLPEGYTWEDFLRGKEPLPGKFRLVIDHIRPLDSFTITDTKCEDFKKAFALENLQILTWTENSHKGAKYEMPTDEEIENFD